MTEFNALYLALQNKLSLGKIEKNLRTLPGKRHVIKTSWRGQSVVAKIYYGLNHHKYMQREHRGLLALFHAGCKTSEILFDQTTQTYSVLLLKYLDTAQTLQALWATQPDNASSLLFALSDALHAQHRYNLVQTDSHLGNYLWAKSQLFCIDGDGIRTKKLTQHECLDNVLQTLAQFPIKDTNLLKSAWVRYLTHQGWSSKIKDFDIALHAARLKRLIKYGKKIFRNCTEFFVEQSFTHRLIARREVCNDSFVDAMKNLDSFIERGRILKAGNTATVAKVNINNTAYVVKRYNIKSWRHALSRCWRPTRAERSWYFGNLLRFSGVTTPQPMALFEKRFGWLRSTAYLLCEYQTGQVLSTEANETQRASALTLYKQLFELKLSHGDLKASNFILDENGPALIDLDAMRFHKYSSGFNRAYQRDLNRFNQNWT